MTGLYGIVIALALLVGLMGLLVLGLLRSHAEILRRLDSLGAGDSIGHQHGGLQLTTKPIGEGTTAPDIGGITPSGDPVWLSPMTGSDPTLIAFLSTSCSSCTPFWESLDAPVRVFGGYRYRVIIATRSEAEESPTRTQALIRGAANVVMSSQAWDDYEVPGAPYFVLADHEVGVIGEGSASSFEALEEFLLDSANDLRWDQAVGKDSRRIDSEENRIDRELRAAGLAPDDPRLYPVKGDLPTEDDSE